MPTRPPGSPPSPGASFGRLRLRAFVLGIALVVASQFWLVQCELVRWSLFTNIVPYCNALCLLAALVGAGALHGWLRPRCAPLLTRGELLCVFSMVCVGSALTSGQMGQILVATLPFMAQYAGHGNHFDRTLLPWMNRRVLVSDPTAVWNFYYGNSSFYKPENYRAWLFPIAFWTVFLVALLWCMLCIATLLRRRWTGSERLSYPTTYLPIEMTAGGAFWSNRMLWIGLGFAALITLYNGIAFFHPVLPIVPIKRQSLDPFMPNPPLSDIGGLQISFYLFAIGLAFLMPLDLSFSLWFFFIAYKLERLLASQWGLMGLSTPGGGFGTQPPYENSQAFGAYASVCVLAVWTARRYLGDVWRTAFGRGPKPLDDSDEPMSYRTAVVGLALGTLVLAAAGGYLGMPPIVFAAFILIFYGLCVAIARIRAEFGFPVHDMSNTGPMNLLVAGVGAGTLGPRTMGAFGLTFWFNRTYFANPTPHFLEAMRMSEVGGVRGRDLVRALLLTAAVGSVTLFWAYLDTAYRQGASTARMMGKIWAWEFPNDGFTQLHNWMIGPNVSNAAGLWAVAAGFLVATVLGLLRQSAPWFPLHPLGYAVANSWGMAQIWLPMLIGWLVKALLTRYGGLRAYRRAVPLFLGLILGEMLVGGFWTLYGILADVPSYDFWP